MFAAHAKVAAAKAAARALAAEAQKHNAVWGAPRPIRPTKRAVTDVADRLWKRKQSSDYSEWTRVDREQKRQRTVGQMVLDRSDQRSHPLAVLVSTATFAEP